MMRFFVLLLCFQLGYGYPNGAPASTCDSMMPEHDVASQQCQANYLLETEKNEFNNNDAIRSNCGENDFSLSDIVRSSYSAWCDQQWSFQGIAIDCEDWSRPAYRRDLVHHEFYDEDRLMQRNSEYGHKSLIPRRQDPNRSLVACTCEHFGWEHDHQVSSRISIDHEIDLNNRYLGRLLSSPTVKSTWIVFAWHWKRNRYVPPSGQWVKRTSVDCFTQVTPLSNQSMVPPGAITATSKTNTNVTWSYANNTVTVTMITREANMSDWRSIGFSLDEEMVSRSAISFEPITVFLYFQGDEYVFVCQVSSTGNVVLRRMHTKPGKRRYSFHWCCFLMSACWWIVLCRPTKQWRSFELPTRTGSPRASSPSRQTRLKPMVNQHRSVSIKIITFFLLLACWKQEVCSQKNEYLMLCQRFSALCSIDQLGKHNQTQVTSKTYQLQNAATVDFDALEVSSSCIASIVSTYCFAIGNGTP